MNETMAAPVEIWTENPNQGNSNPGTKSGSEIFKLKTKGLSEKERLSLDRKDAQTFRRLLEAKEPTLGQVVTHIPITFATGGTPTRHANIISDYSSISLMNLQRNAHARFGTALVLMDLIPGARPWPRATINPGTDPDDKITFFNRDNANVVHE